MRTLKVLGTLFLLAAVCLAVMLILGSRLPHAHTATATIVLPAPQARAWQALEDTASYPKWRAELTAVVPAPSEQKHPCWTEVQKHMRMLLCEDLSAQPSTRIVRIADPSLPFGGSWTYELQPIDANSSRLTITENGNTGPALWRFLGHYAFHEDASIKLFESELQKSLS